MLTYAVKEIEAASWRIRNFADAVADTGLRMRRVPLDEFLDRSESGGAQQNGKLRLPQSSTPAAVAAQAGPAAPASALAASAPRPGAVDFVWQNKATTDFQPLRRAAFVYNHLCGAEIFEDKAKLALLLKKSSTPENSLRSLTFETAAKFAQWCRRTHASWGEKLWVAKTPRGNSGTGVWMLGPRSWEDVVGEIISSVSDNGGQSGDSRSGDVCGRGAASRYAVVVQEYVASPMLWHGRKLQFRVYAIITGDLSCWIYRHGMLQFCNKPFSKQDTRGDGDDDNSSSHSYDDEVHITNVCRNVANADLFVKEKPCDLAARYPYAFRSMKSSLADLVTQASPFLAYQRSEHHFEFIGVDFIVDAMTGKACLIECNCPPNNTGSDTVGAIEDFHQDLCNDLLRAFVLTPVLKQRRAQREREDAHDREEECGLWEEARAPAEVGSERFAPTRDPGLLARNGMAFLLYQAKANKLVAAEVNAEMVEEQPSSY